MAQVIYVSGRKRETGEMNGKSGNINNCCSQIYPRGVKIPSNELVCIFDADQARHWPCNLPALALAPTCRSPSRRTDVHEQAFYAVGGACEWSAP